MIKLIAEIGWNHMGDMDLAKRMIYSAHENGADICKFQTWSEKKLKPGPWDFDGRREIYKKAQLSVDDHLVLKDYCKSIGSVFMTSVFNENDLKILTDLGLNSVKIPSHEIHNTNLIKSSAKLFEKIFISCGASNWDEIKILPNLISSKNYVLMHCVSTYPCPPEKINFPRMDEIKKISPVFGYSGHYNNIEDGMIAICKGAKYIEKHFTIDQSLPGRDNKFAILPSQMKDLSNFRNLFESMTENLGMNLQGCEKDTYENYRGRWSGK